MPRVLLLESDVILAKSIGRLLHLRKHQVVWKPDPQSAINAADRLHPDIVVLDLSLGAHNGIEFLYEFRSYPEWLSVPVVLFTSHGKHELEGLEQAFSELGVAAILHKPLAKISHLADQIQNLVPATA